VRFIEAIDEKLFEDGKKKSNLMARKKKKKKRREREKRHFRLYAGIGGSWFRGKAFGRLSGTTTRCGLKSGPSSVTKKKKKKKK
jgi:hypothetical protein